MPNRCICSDSPSWRCKPCKDAGMPPKANEYIPPSNATEVTVHPRGTFMSDSHNLVNRSCPNGFSSICNGHTKLCAMCEYNMKVQVPLELARELNTVRGQYLLYAGLASGSIAYLHGWLYCISTTEHVMTLTSIVAWILAIAAMPLIGFGLGFLVSNGGK